MIFPTTDIPFVRFTIDEVSPFISLSVSFMSDVMELLSFISPSILASVI